MSTAEEIILQEPSSKSERKFYLEYISSVVKDIPDEWDVSEYEKRPDAKITVIFTWASDEIKKICKFWAWTLLTRQDFQGSSVRSMVDHAKYFFKFALDNHGASTEKDNFYDAWMDYVGDLQRRVKSSIVKDCEDSLQPRTASQYANNTLLMLAQLGGVYKGFEWVFRRDYSVLLPHEISSYMSGEERYQFRQELVRLQFVQKSKVIPYDDLLKITRVFVKCSDPYLKAAMTVALHTGLRITEVLVLKKGCLVPVSDDEIKDSLEYRRKHKIGLGGVDPDWSEMYWLKGHQVIKDKQTKEWAIGTPILVSKVVYDTLKEIEEFTDELREENGSEYLFINKAHGVIKVRSYAALHKAKNKFIQDMRLPYFAFHMMRATFATMLYDLGVPEEMIQKYLNHIKIDTTSGYISSSHERDYMEMSAVSAGKMLGINVSNQKVNSFANEVIGVASASEWEHLDYFDQLAVYASIKRKHDLSVVYYDHGFCMLALGESCQYGYGDVKPCYLSECEKFEPDASEIPSFIEMLQERKRTAPELSRLYDGQAESSPEYKDELDARMMEFQNDTQTLIGLIDRLKQESKGI
ncbi:MAG: site-specific integrase [Sulfuricurvum sp.]|uniref:site-specific integrase n=1 Tax=Sulfuricurvum sp. TaxID=2025608 RepID=UPI00262AC4DB|nr:site-specific integrase [Sulfuricurvum sp.]MDD5118147.1 site-specific integrase [Sulfuricurvum sp.]